MRYHINRKIRLNEDPEHKSLYKWCLEETDDNGRLIEPDRGRLADAAAAAGDEGDLAFERELREVHMLEVTPRSGIERADA